MCDRAERWSPEIFCGPRGRCVDSVCVCEPGWGNDLTTFKTRNCWLPHPAINIIDGLVGSASFVAFIVVFREMLKARSYARTFLQLTAASMLFASIYLLAHYLEGGTHGPGTIVFFYLAIRFASDGIALAIYQMLKSYWKMTGKGKNFKKYVIGVQVTEAIALLIPSIVMIGLNGNDDVFSVAMSFFLVVFALHFAGLLLFIIVSTTSVINTVEQAAPPPSSLVDSETNKQMWESNGLASGGNNNSTTMAKIDEVPRRKSILETFNSMASKSPFNVIGSSSNGTFSSQNLIVSNEGPGERRTSNAELFSGSTSSMRLLGPKSQELVHKVRQYRRFGKLVGPLVLVAIFIVCLLEWSLGAVPLMWVLYGISVLHFPVIGLVQTLLAKSNATANLKTSSRRFLLTSGFATRTMSGPLGRSSNLA